MSRCVRNQELTDTDSDHGPPPPGPIIPTGSISGTALVAVVAIMTFLAALAVGAIGLVYVAAADWRADVAREMTIQVRPVDGRNLAEDVRRAGEVARATRGIADVRVYSQAEAERLLEPWLGSGLDLTGLPVPRLIGLRLGAAGSIRRRSSASSPRRCQTPASTTTASGRPIW